MSGVCGNVFAEELGWDKALPGKQYVTALRKEASKNSQVPVCI